MNNRILYYFVILFVILLFSIVILHFRKITENYKTNFITLDNAKINMLFQDPLIRYYQINGDCPSSLDSLFPKMSSKTIDSLKLLHYKDVLSSNIYQTLQYIPLYNTDKEKNAFVLISTGIDGKLDNTYDYNDTILKNNFIAKFSFYNNFSFENQYTLQLDSINNKFHLYQYLFGKKDYLVCYVDLVRWKKSTLD